MQRAIGLDLNGWHDFSARDREEDASDAPGGADVSVDGGYGGVVVSHGGMTVGGPQAILSPIGRGNGWSDVGAREKRGDLRALWPALLTGTFDPRSLGHLRVAADALAVRAGAIGLCMPDRPEMAEAGQQALLKALAGPRRPAATLIWRSVALTLAALDGGLLPQARDGMRVLCAIHAADGLEVQSLVLRRVTEHPHLLAPERGGPGGVLCREVGLARLLAEAEGALAAANPRLGDHPTETPRLPLVLLLDEYEPSEPEVIRRDNGTWTLAHPPAAFRLPWAPLPAAPALAADVVLLHSPLASRHRDGLTAWLGVDGRMCRVTAPDAPALGALHALRRMARGIPHYLDRLDQVSLAVLGPSGPVFEDLIPPHATVPGNREYVSAPITSMVWPKGMKTANFFIRKGEREIRTWTTPELTAPEEKQPLDIRLRQKPAQGWANLLITAPHWEELRRAPIRLEWSALQVDPRSAEQVLEWLEGPLPIAPDPVHYAAEIGLWDGSLRAPGLRQMLKHARQGLPHSLHELADALGNPYSLPILDGVGSRRVYAVGTDGKLPQDLDPETTRLFEDTIADVADDLMRRRRRGQGPANNDALRCLTWCFVNCPPGVVDELAVAVRAREEGRPHPWMLQPGAVVVVFQGLGRVATEPAMLEEMIPRLAGGPPIAYRAGALAAMLSRPAATPAVLGKLDVPRLAARMADVLDDIHQAHNFGVRLKYALLAVGGLLRVRALDPWALVADRSPPANRLADRLDAISERLAAHPHGIAGAVGKQKSAEATIELLRGASGRPDILTVVDALPEN